MCNLPVVIFSSITFKEDVRVTGKLSFLSAALNKSTMFGGTLATGMNNSWST